MEVWKDEYYYFQNYLNDNEVKEFLLELKELPERIVNCGIDNVSWGEQQITSSSEIYKNFFASDRIIQLIKKLIDREDDPIDIVCWTSVYRRNEYINRHKDVAGDVQILVGLENLGTGNEGLLHLEKGSFKEKIFLGPGDMIVFNASDVYHYTSPIREGQTEVKRIITVGRYFFAS